MMICRREQIEEPCPNCGEMRWIVKKLVNSGGATTYPYFCGTCGLKTQLCERKAVVAKLDYVPEEVQPTRPRPNCEVCGAEGAERHHWAPTAIFGEEAERWPKSYLCPACHARWHRLVTANMCGDA